MAVLAAVIICMLYMVYINTYKSVYNQNQNIMSNFLLSYSLGSEPYVTNQDENEYTDSSVLYLVTFYEDGEVADIMNDVSPLMSDDELSELAAEILGEEGSESSGISEGMLYRTENFVTYTCVIMMSADSFYGNMNALARNMMAAGAGALILLFGATLFLENRTLRPVRIIYEKQKQFISDAGHELKTPISAIGTNAQVLEGEIGKNKWLSNIIHENNRMKDLVISLLDLARTDEVAMKKDDVDLSRIVLGCVLPMESFAYEKGIIIETDVEEDIHVPGDEAWLSQLVSVLTDNAISHYEKTDGDKECVCISLKSERANAVLKVSNPGEEIPDSVKKGCLRDFTGQMKQGAPTVTTALGFPLPKT